VNNLSGIDESLIESILDKVDRPARYIGGELGAVNRQKNEGDISFAFCFPDTYELAMSHLGMKILYEILNDTPGVICERVCMPWKDMYSLLKENNIPLFSLENRTPLHEFDIVGFTFQYEMNFTNVLAMLELGGVEILSRDRKDNSPIVIAGGPSCCNPEPMSSFIDAFFMGDGERGNIEICECIRSAKQKGLSRRGTLLQLSRIEGIYVPEFYSVSYNSDGTIKEVVPNVDGVPENPRRRIEKSIEELPFPKKPIVPFTQAVHDRMVLEIMRGCTQGCRFCQAGMLYRPVRERSVESLMEYAKTQEKATGYEEISLSSLSSGDYSHIDELVEKLIAEFSQKRVSVSLPSLRLDSQIKGALEEASKVKKSGLTLAPEAGTQRLRDVINKRITHDDIMQRVKEAFSIGYSNIKLYFMMGLPTETYEDLDGIVQLAKDISAYYHSLPKRPKGLRITVSTSTFVPKPFTPFQWAAQDDLETILKKQEYLRNSLRIKGVQYNWHEAELSVLEAAIARGNRNMGKVIYSAYKNGAMLDSWREHFSFDIWQKAFLDNNINMDFYSSRERKYDEILPWDIIDIGVSRDYLMRENERAKVAQTTRDCRQGCMGCGLQNIEGACV